MSFGNVGVKRPWPHSRSGSLAIVWLSTPTIRVDTRQMASSESASQMHGGTSAPAQGGREGQRVALSDG